MEELNEKQIQNFGMVYDKVRRLYVHFVTEQQIPPMQVFGVFLGVIAQEFREHSTKESFDKFLKEIQDLPWDEPTVN